MTHATRVPTTITDLTPAWMTSTLRTTGAIAADCQVSTVEAQVIAEGVGFLSNLYRLNLTLTGPGPATLVAKLPATTDYLQLATAVGAYEREIAFYSAVSPHCPIRTPKAYAADIASETGDFILLLEDLGHLENGNHLAGLEFDRAEAVIDELVRLHAWAWNLDAAPARQPAFVSIDSPVSVGMFTMAISAGWSAYLPNARVDIPSGLAEIIEGWAERLPMMMSTLKHPTTLINGDLRVDNLFFDAAERPTTVDFQLVMHGSGIWDVAYLIGQGMSPAQRDGQERELVRRYVEGLQAKGIDYHFDQAWQQFRTAVVAQITMPLSAGMAWATLNDRAKELLHTLNERAFAIIADTDAIASLPG